jgi:MFS family permease
MSGLVFYIGLGLGLAAACGLRPFLPLLLAGALASSGALGVSFSGAGFAFLGSAWWLLVAAAGFVLAYALQMLFGLSPAVSPNAAPLPSRAFPAALRLLGFTRERRRENALAASIAGLGMGAGAALFGGTLAAHGDSPWPGILVAFLVVGLAQRASGPVIARARERLPDRGAREALTIYLDAASLAVAALVALFHPLGYVAVALLAWFLWRMRSRSAEKYAGLRILRR